MKLFYNKVNSLITLLARKVSKYAGSSVAILLAFLAVIIWFAFGPFYHFSTDYQIIINTGTTIITFLLVFLIQNTQNRDSHAIHLKLDELLQSGKEARDKMIGVNELDDIDIDRLQKEFAKDALEKSRRLREERLERIKKASNNE